MAKKFRQCLFILFFFTSCGNKDIVIQNLAKDTLIKVKTNTSYPTNLRLKVTGFTDDNCIINNTIINKGKIDTLLQSDWYKSEIVISYKAYKAKSGNIVIKYEL
jgi:hypothetical protein